MFAYCRNNPASRTDISGFNDIESNATILGEDEDELAGPKGAGANNSAQNSSPVIQTDAAKGGSSTPNGSTVIYRYGYTEGNAEKLVPSNTDVAHQDKSGLSFSTKMKPDSGMTTIEEVNSTGVLYAVVDGKSHVSVYPVGATLAQWQAAGIDSIWTKALLGIMRITPIEEVEQR